MAQCNYDANAIAALSTKLDAIAAQIENLEMDVYRICTMCQGTGTVIPSHNHSEPPPAPITCPSCSGAGRVKVGSSTEKD